MNYFFVEYELDGEQKCEKIEGTDAGNAFAKCLKAHPGCHLLRASQYGKPGGKRQFEELVIQYDAPSVMRVEPLPIEKTEQTEFGFV